jgi:dimethylhistidine N-methyltransferase
MIGLNRKRSVAAAPRVVRLAAPASDEQAALVSGLMASPASISPKYFYDDTGCELFTRICRLDEYYPTRTEEAIFEQYARDIARFIPASSQWIDLGCGDCGKSRRWIDVAAPARFVGVDIAEPWLRSAMASLAADYPQVECLGVAADFTRGLDLQGLLAEHAGAPVFFYPGSSIGNFSPAQALDLLRQVRRHCGRDGKLLIGVDLVKDEAVLHAAYNDGQGITAEFNRNALQVVNRVLGSDFNLDAYRHLAYFNAQQSRIEMHLESLLDQQVSVGSLRRRFMRGETILTEHSCKYRADDFAAMLHQAGFGAQRSWTDSRGWFAVFLAEVV